MRKIAVTGTIGSGKTTFCILLRRRRMPVFDADGYGKTALQKTNLCYQKITDAFGTDILDAQGEIVPKKLAAVIFSDEQKREMLNQIVHPYVLEGMKHFFERHNQDALVFAEIPLLYETGWDQYFDDTVVVTCKKETAVKRLMEDRGYSRQEALQRFASQIDPETQIAKADFVFHNDGSITDLDHAAAKWIAALRKEGTHGAQA